MRWLRAEYSTRTDARAALGVRDIIDDASFYDYLKLLARFVVIAGYEVLQGSAANSGHAATAAPAYGRQPADALVPAWRPPDAKVRTAVMNGMLASDHVAAEPFARRPFHRVA